MKIKMKNLINEIFPKPQDLFNSPEDEMNKLLSEVAEAQKEEVLPILIECRKCSNPVKEGESLCDWCI